MQCWPRYKKEATTVPLQLKIPEQETASLESHKYFFLFSFYFSASLLKSILVILMIPFLALGFSVEEVVASFLYLGLHCIF